MATVQPAFGTIKGKIGNLRFSDWNGVNTVAQQPASYTDANTPVQQANRSSFAALAQLGRQVVAAIRIGFSQYSYQTSPWAKFMEVNTGQVVDDATGFKLPTPDQLKFAQGSMPGLLRASTTPNVGAGTVEVEWDDNTSAFGASADDKLVLVQVDMLTKQASYEFAPGNRASLRATIPVINSRTGNDYHIYGFFVDAMTGKVTSDSVLVR